MSDPSKEPLSAPLAALQAEDSARRAVEGAHALFQVRPSPAAADALEAALIEWRRVAAPDTAPAEGWKQELANAAAKSIEHPIVEDVIAEFMFNIRIADTGAPAYGIRKVAEHAAQVAHAEALGIDPNRLRAGA